eukprot:CAMPEP_0114246426 /NCGR_PEP_ID=MMETSP0058-20121206/12454_1 /TAXON_ID=36894 /ORGANISM="Pyramimonas parkeae, CCMP726" /LENGTH=264 /DNA_ID=CAMNT_0001359607 /DNA_START=239 /DNA_END=1033 /DNA_ORIENTATION=+
MAAQKSLLALDFDGVLCDSCGESSLSAWKAAEKLWPEVFRDATSTEKDKILQDMRVVRPVVETGYENMLLIRALIEKLSSPQELLDTWGTVHHTLMDKWDLDRAEMVDLFGKTRDDWIATDFTGWLAPNEFYPGVVDATKAAIANAMCETYIVTTKQARFTSALMNDMAGIPFEDDRIYSTTVSGQPKTEVLKMLQEDKGIGAELHFVEDKLSTLEKVLKDPGLDKWNLYLVDWGYNTASERKWAEDNPRIRLISIAEFSNIIQ